MHYFRVDLNPEVLLLGNCTPRFKSTWGVVPEPGLSFRMGLIPFPASRGGIQLVDVEPDRGSLFKENVLAGPPTSDSMSIGWRMLEGNRDNQPRVHFKFKPKGSSWTL